jgi:threonine dehydrogenase-like Zn-dependent dehydrogenase
MNISFENKVALVTGAASGLGLATAKAFATSGASVALADWNEEGVRAAAEELTAAGPHALAIQCDVADDAQVEAMVAQTVAASGRLDAAYNNAGVQNVVAETADQTSLLALSDVMGTDWFAAGAANVKRGATVAVVGDGAVGLLGVLSAKQMGAERIIAMSRHASRQKLAREFGATDIGTERGDEGVARIKELTKGVGADSVLECVGTQESMAQAIQSTRTGGSVGYVGVPHGVELNAEGLFYAHLHLHGGPAPVRHYLPDLINRVLSGKINPGKVFDLTLPLDQAADGYRAMDERRAIKTLLRPTNA